MKNLILFICLIQMCGFICAQRCSTYTVQKGDSCYSLGINQALNPNINCNPLAENSQICIVYGAATCGSGSYSYTIKSGDTCYSLGLSTTAASNQNLNCANLQIGQSICVPYYTATTQANSISYCGSGSYVYTIKSGDTCNALGLNAAAVSSQNLNCANLQIGQTICVPYSNTVTTTATSSLATCSPGYYLYTIKSGDTCNALGLNAAAISSQNLNCKNLQVGQLVCVPLYNTLTTTAINYVSCSQYSALQYTVKLGDTCNSLGISVSLANQQGINCASLQVGQQVCIPYNAVTTTQSPYTSGYPSIVCSSGTYAYTVKSGDTCNSLGITATAAASQNLNCGNLQVGSLICAPYYTPVTNTYYPPSSTPSFYPGNNLQCGSNAFPYTVRSGDSCFNLQITQAYAANNNINCNNALQVGSAICLPLSSLTTPLYYTTTTTTMPSLSLFCGLNTYSYTIKNGDSCYSLGITQTLASAQNINCNLLQVGSTICAPYYSGSNSNNNGNIASNNVCKTSYYTVQPGDSCQSISASRNYLYTDLIALNGGNLNCNNLQQNQVNCV